MDSGLEKLLSDDQKKTLKQMQADFAKGNAGRPPGAPPGGGGGAPPAFMFGGQGGGGSVFRAYRYGPDYAGLAGKDLKPGKTVEELQPKEPAPAKDSAKLKDATKK